MKEKMVGKVSESEKNEAMLFTERLYALHELKLGKDNLDLTQIQKKDLFIKIADKEVKTKQQLDKWWQEKYNKYKWERIDNAHWEINFENCNVILKYN